MNTLLLGLALIPSAPALKGPAKGDTPPIEGTWQLVEWTQKGTAVSFWDGMTVDFQRDGKRVVRESPDSVEERSYKLIPKTSPAAIDLIRPSGGAEPVVHPCIFKIDDDTLTISIGGPGGERPTSFEGASADVLMVMTYKRVKKK